VQAYFGTKLTPRLSLTPSGFLICKDATVCRTGTQRYRGDELGLGTSDIVVVDRPRAEVFAPKFLASLEGSVITDNHPPRFIDSDTAAWSVKGHAQNIRRGPRLKSGDDSVIADLIIYDAALIQKILSGTARELSVGYSVDYVPNSRGGLVSTRLRGNHIAIVAQSRCGQSCCIQDSEGEEMPKTKTQDDELTQTELLAQILARLERLELKQEPDEDDDEEETATDDGRALQLLRSIRPTIEAHARTTGDRKAIDEYNSAIKTLKSRMKNSRAIVSDSARQLRVEVDPDRAWEDAIRRAGARMRGEIIETTAEKPATRVSSTFDAGATFLQPRKLFDPDPSDTNDFVDSHNAAGRALREG